MAVTDQQKIDFLLKKIGFTKTKTGSTVGTGAISGTPKQPFAEAIPSPLIIANGALWNESDSIPATPPGSDTSQVKVYLAGTSGLRLTADATSSGQRAYIAYSTYNNTSSTRLTNWIDTQFGAGYLIKVYKGDPNSGGVALSAAGSGANDGWFFDYSAGVLNFNDTNVPSGVTDTNIYIVGYRYIGQTGAPSAGIGTFSFKDLTVERNLDVGPIGGISTFRNNIDANGIIEGIAGENKIPSLYANLAALPSASTYHGMFAHVHSTGRAYYAHAGNWIELVNKDTSGNVGLSGDLDVDGHTNLDNVSIAGVTTFAGIIEGIAGENKIPSLYANLAALPSASTYHGMFAHVHSTGRGYFAHAGNWLELVNKDTSGNVGLSGDLDVDGHTNLDNISVAGVSTFTGDATFSGNVSIGGTLTYEDVTNVDSVGLLTARSGIRVTGGVIEAQAGENKIPSLYANMAALPSPSTYHGMFAHVHSTGRGYFAHGGAWYELVNADLTGRVGTGTESYFIDRLVSTSTTATSLNVTGVTTAVTVDINGDLDVDGHTNLDNVSVAGVSTFAGDIVIPDSIVHSGDTDTKIRFPQDNNITFETSGSQRLRIDSLGRIGIGQPSPQYKLDILETTNTRALFIKYGNSTNNTSGVEIQNSSGAGKLFLGVWGPSTGAYGQVNANDAFIGSPEDWSIHSISNTGVIKFGIGSSGPVEKMRITSTGVDISRDLDVDGHTNLDNVSIAGVTTTAGNVDINADLDVDGHTNLDNVSVAGVTTTAGLLDINAGGQANTFKVEDLTSGRVVFAGTGGELEDSNNLRFDGTDLFVSGIRVGSGSGGIIGQDIITRNLQVNGISTFIGIATFNNATFHGDIDVDGHTNLDNVSIAGVVTATTFVGNGDLVELDVDGHTNLDNVSIAGVTTFTGTAEFDGTAKFDSTITAGGATGTNGQYLKSTGTGVAWASFPTLRTRQTFTASAGQTTFSFTYTVNFIDVFVNGIKLTDAEFTATNGSSVVLAVGCFVGDIVELVSYNTVSSGGGGGGGSLNNIVEDTTPQLGGNLDLFSKTIDGTGGINITGVVTATSFVGDGSALTGVVGSGSGVIIQHDGSNVGTAGTINFSTNLDVTPISAGIVTVTASGGGSGISTIGGVVNIVSDIDVDGHTNLDNVSVAGVTTFAGLIDANGGITATTGTFEDLNGGNRIVFSSTSGSGGRLDDSPNLTFINGTNTLNVVNISSQGSHDIDGDLDVDGHTNLDNVSIAGVVTATTLVGAIQGTSGAFSSHVNITGDLDVDGHTDLDNVSVAGVSTFAGITTVTGNTLFAKQLNVLGISTFNDIVDIKNLRLQTNGTGEFIESTGTGGLSIQSNYSVKIKQNGFPNRNYAIFSDGGASFYRGGNQTLSDTSNGWTFYNHIKPSADSTYDLGTNTDRFRNVYADMLYGDGSNLTNLPGGGSYGNNDVDNHLNVSGASSGQILSWNGSDYAWVADQTGGGGSGISTISGVVNIADDLDVDGDTILDHASVAGVVTFTNVSNPTPSATLPSGTGGHIYAFDGLNLVGRDNIIFQQGGFTRWRIASGHFRPHSDSTVDIGTNTVRVRNIYADTLYGNGSNLTGVASNVGITTHAQGSFTASAGTPATINTYAYGGSDVVVEYTIFIQNGSNTQTQKLLATRLNTNIDSTQFAVMFTSSLLVQCDAVISSGNILLRATPETGVSGSTVYKVKREVM